MVAKGQVHPYGSGHNAAAPIKNGSCLHGALILLDFVVTFALTLFFGGLLIIYRVLRHHNRSWHTYRRSKDPVPLIFYIPISTGGANILKPFIMAALF